MESSRNTEWWDNMLHPARRVWHGVALRLGIRKPGLLKLRHDVRACAYEDVQIMWDMLRQNEIQNNSRIPGKIKRRPLWNRFGWGSFPLCRSF
uniref:Uncharacterized protein LOC105630867 n=1 Tax=Rhizophora mucronata TaxID=61149 RepID=A0A2P2JDE8_RHIMU